MKWNLRHWLVVGLLGAFLFAGCATQSEHAVTVAPNGQVMVADRQDKAQRELAGVSGSGPYGWIKGFWTNYDGHWVWVPGHWEEPINGGNWVAGHWDRTPEGWMWIPGHWV